MWDAIIRVLLKQIESNPDRVLSLAENLVAILKDNPAALNTLVKILQKKYA